MKKDYEAIVLHFYPEMLQRIFKDINPEIVNRGHVIKKKNVADNDGILEKYMDKLLFYFNNPGLETGKPCGF